MDNDYKKVLYIDFESLSYEFKVHGDLYQYIGGMGVSYKLLNDNINSQFLILSTGPLSGYFPYVSKANLAYFHDGKVVDLYGGGSIAALLNMAQIDAVVMKKPLLKYVHADIFSQDINFSTYKKDQFEKSYSDFSFDKRGAFSQNYFSFQSVKTSNPFTKGGISLSIKSTESLDLTDYYDYEKLYEKALDDYRLVTEEPRNNPSCMGCPLGCDKSNLGEEGLNIAVLPRCLISCAYAEEIYKSIPHVYACLSSVGYNYRHSDLEKLPDLVGDLKTQINLKLGKNEDSK